MKKMILAISIIAIQILAMDVHSEDASYEEMGCACNVCQLLNHQQLREVCNSDLSIMCGICQKGYTTDKDFMNHFLKDHTCGLYTCCGQLFNYSEINMHVKENHQIGFYEPNASTNSDTDCTDDSIIEDDDRAQEFATSCQSNSHAQVSCFYPPLDEMLRNNSCWDYEIWHQLNE